ncbi:MAG TPA: hypothetical protein VH601_04765 [Bryobacteraceae bacterium]
MIECEPSTTFANVTDLIEDSAAVWDASPADFPHLESYIVDEQERRERLLDCHLDAIDVELRQTSRTRMAAERTIARITSLFVQVSTYSLEIDNPRIQNLLESGFSQVGTDLARSARRLDPDVSMIDILQAARNAWTACGLQVILGRTLRLTPAIFAYSMLYPYSDNCLDDPAISRETKLRFNERFRRRLQGERSPANNKRDEIVWYLVGLIESEYPRAKYPQVYDSLLAIHTAQQESLRQMERAREDCDVLRLTLAKGGTSVLADAYLAAGQLKPLEARFAFNWGVALQLGDDLQDLYADQARGSLTLFTQAAERGSLDAITSKTFHFSGKIMDQMSDLASASAAMKDLLARSSRMLLIRSAANAPEAYTGPYLAALEQNSPFRFDFLRERETRFARRRRSYARLFEQVVSRLPEWTPASSLVSAPQLASS